MVIVAIVIVVMVMDMAVARHTYPPMQVMLAFGCGGCDGGLETIGVARAPRWNATYTFTSPHPIATPSDFGCPTGQVRITHTQTHTMVVVWISTLLIIHSPHPH